MELRPRVTGPEALSRSGGQKNAITSGVIAFSVGKFVQEVHDHDTSSINSLRRSPRMTRKRKLIVGTLIGLMTVLVGSAFALSNIALLIGTIPAYDFGIAGPGYSVPATVQIHAFTMKPGDAVPWHFHKGLSYVILAHGRLTEEHLVGPDQCVSEEFTRGSAFVESPGQVHSVKNTGDDVAVIWWATVFPKSDGIVEFAPGFKVGGVYPVPAPNCN
jgi:hypothetical protein